MNISINENITFLLAADRNEFIAQAISHVQEAARRALARRGVFHIVLAGGDTPRAVYSALVVLETEWTAWQIWFGDERCLPPGDSGLNSTMAMETLLSRVPLPPENIHRIRGELGAAEAARLYEKETESVPCFDLVLLGLGDDGHTASLFPGHDWGTENDAVDVLAVFDAPKPPLERVSLSVQRLKRTREVLFLAAGEQKRSVVKSYRRGESMPATMIHGLERTTLLYCPASVFSS